MSQPVHLVAIMTPREGKVDRVIELLNDLVEIVKETEPNTLRYQLHREINKKTGLVDLVMLESYTDMAAVRAHGSTKEFKKFYKTLQEEDLITGPTQLKWLMEVSGFASRL